MTPLWDPPHLPKATSGGTMASCTAASRGHHTGTVDTAARGSRRQHRRRQMQHPHEVAAMLDVHAVLLLTNGADAGTTDSSSRTPLAHTAAACRGHSDALLALARHLPQVLAQRSWAGNTPLHELWGRQPSDSCWPALLALAEGGLLTSAALAAAAGSDEAVGVLLLLSGTVRLKVASTSSFVARNTAEREAGRQSVRKGCTCGASGVPPFSGA